MRLPITFILLSLTATSLLPAAILSWDRTEVELEMKPEQEEIRASFTVTNEDKKRIRIARVKTSCGCTGSIIDRKILEPGESTEIIATFAKGKRQGTNVNNLKVYIDSQPDPVATLRMRVIIPKLIEATPMIAYWTPTSTQTERRITVTLDERFVDTITGIEYDEKKVNIVEEEPASGDASLILRVTPKSYDVLYRGNIIIKAKGKGGRTAETKAMVFVQP
jgi:hypothetical protein